MAMAVTFDTLAYSRKLKETGVPERQAEIQAEALAEIIQDQLTTKNELITMENAVKQEIRDDIRILDSDLKQRFSKVENTMQQKFLEVEHKFSEVENTMQQKFSEIDNRFIKVETRLDQLDAKIDIKTAELKAGIIKWVFAISAGQAVLIVSLLKFFH